MLDDITFLNIVPQSVFHVPDTLFWCLVSAGIFGLDLLVRLIQTHYVTATIHYVPELKSTRVVIPALRSGWLAGQHVRLTVPSVAMGVTQALESHPFTIASTSEDEEGMVLYCREAGDWTRRLAHLARGTSRDVLAMSKLREAGFGAGRRVNVLVQGPYGASIYVCLSCAVHSPSISMARRTRKHDVLELFRGDVHLRRWRHHIRLVCNSGCCTRRI